jgi:hypothetical protein
MVGDYMSTTYFPGLQPWGAFQPSRKTLYIQGKGWSRDPLKTQVKVNGKEVKIVGWGGTMLPENQLQIDMPDINGSFEVTVVSEGLESQPKSFYRGIPQEILHKMPLLSFKHSGIINYSENGKARTDAFSFTLAYAYNTIESYSWSGNTLTIIGKGQEYIGTQKAVLTFNEFGTKVNKVEVEVKSLNLDIKYIINDLDVELWGTYNQLKFVRTKIPASNYQSMSGTKMTTEPRYVYTITSMGESQPSWPNEFAVWFDLKN